MSLMTTKSPKGGPIQNSTYELFIGFLAVFSLVVMALIFLLPSTSPSRDILLALDSVISFIFLFDFFRSLIVAPSKKAYLKWGWLDLLGSIPAVPAFRLARLARIGRVVRAVRGIKAQNMLQVFLRQRAESTLIGTLLAVILVLTFASLAILEFESLAPGANIQSGVDAIWWAFVTITTVGYGDRFPVTLLGRIIAIITSTVGVGLFGVLTSYLSTKFIVPNRTDEAEADSSLANNKSVNDELAALRDEMTAIQTKLDRIEQLLQENQA
jgi:voltage-gated potassium channel